MKIILVLIAVLGAAAAANGQTAASTPAPAVTRTIINTRRVEENPGVVRDLGTKSRTDRNRESSVAGRTPAFRKPSREDLLTVAPDRETAAKYADFLRRPQTGLIRLLSDAGCQENAGLVSANEFCLKYKNVFGGSVYSFRTENYTLGRFSDVAYKDGVLYATGKMTLGFLTDLGTEVAPGDVSAQTAGGKYVFDFDAPKDLPQIETALANFQRGVEANGFQYRRFFRLEENHTYLLRSIAYRRGERREGNQVIYDELNDDEREDVVVALQVVGFADAEKSSVVLLWKKLRRKDAAKIPVAEK